METTERVVGERRSNTLRELAATSVEGQSEEPHVRKLPRRFWDGNRFDISFAVLYGVSPDRKQVHPRSWTGISPDHVLCQGEKS